MLIGHYFQNLSGKGRTALPARIRRELGKQVILSRWYEGSLAIFAPDAWQRIVEQATRGQSVTAPARDTERFLLGGAYEIELDGQGRFVIPQALREYGRLEGEVVFVGLGNRVEVWDKAGWSQRERQILPKAEKLIEQVQKEKS